MREETGYQWIQGTRPQTLAFGADRLAGRPRGLDRGEVPRLVGLRRRCRARHQPRPHARRYLALLVHRRDRLVILALLRPASWLAILPPGEVITVPTGYAQFPREILKPPRSAAERVFKEHPPLERHGEGRTFRGAGTTRSSRARGTRLLPGIALS